MKLDIKINEYKKNIETLQAVESLEVYRWLISLGEKLNDDPLTKIKRIEKNSSIAALQWAKQNVHYTTEEFCISIDSNLFEDVKSDIKSMKNDHLDIWIGSNRGVFVGCEWGLSSPGGTVGIPKALSFFVTNREAIFPTRVFIPIRKALGVRYLEENSQVAAVRWPIF